MSKDYYNVLGVSQDASQEEIKKAYRKKAHKHHPDKDGGDEERFKKVNEAYQILGDPQKRKQYDQFGGAFGDQGGAGAGFSGFDFSQFSRGGQGFQGNIDLEDLFGDLFSNFGARGQRSRRRGKDIAIDITVSLEEAFRGTVKEVELKKYTQCSVCNGTGAEPETEMKTCGECGGDGEIRNTRRTMFGALSQVRTCKACGGEGERPETPCKECSGEGRVRAVEELSIPIPAGIADGNVITINGRGEEPPKGGSPGNLIVRVSVAKHPKLTREGDDLYSTKEVLFPQVVFGDVVTVKTINGEEEVKIPKGTQSGSQITLKGKGMPRTTGSSSGGRGNQYVTVQVTTPQKLSKKAKKLLKELREELK